MGPDSSLHALPELGLGGAVVMAAGAGHIGGPEGTGDPGLFSPSPFDPLLCSAWRGAWQSSALQGGAGDRQMVLFGRAAGTSQHGVAGGHPQHFWLYCLLACLPPPPFSL